MGTSQQAENAGNWDFIVVGAGSAGSIVAARLSENGTRRVLLLEAGPPATPLFKPFGLGYYVDLSRYEWGYWSEPDPTRGGRTDHWRRGRVVGGSGNVNGMHYVRGTRDDYDQWAAMGNTGWSADDVMPLFRDIESCQPGFQTPPDPSIRGLSGPLPIREVRRAHPLTEAYLEAAEAAGHPRTPDYNGARQEGVGYAQYNQRRGLRVCSADAFLKPALTRKNLTLLTDALVHKLSISQGRVTGVVFEHKGKMNEARADKVVLCGGAINTPQLLMLSGIGDAQALTSHGIEVVMDRPQVGRNLMEHPNLRMAFRVNITSYNPTEGWLQKAGFLAKFLLTRQGPIAALFEAQSFLRTSPEERVPDIQSHFVPCGMVISNDVKFYKGVKVLDYPSITFIVNKNYPESRGQITLASADPKAAPRIDPNLLGDDRDVETLVRSIDLFRRIARTRPLADLITEDVEPMKDLVSHDELADYVRGQTSLSYHPSGTCRMGPEDSAVVAPDLKVRGLENLWIADASVMPRLVSGNINAASMMIGEKLGRQLSHA